MCVCVLFAFLSILTLKVRGRSLNQTNGVRFPPVVQIRSRDLSSDDGDVEDVGYSIKKKKKKTDKYIHYKLEC